jgi:hypothetical protein
MINCVPNLPIVHWRISVLAPLKIVTIHVALLIDRLRRVVYVVNPTVYDRPPSAPPRLRARECVQRSFLGRLCHVHSVAPCSSVAFPRSDARLNRCEAVRAAVVEAFRR